VIRQTEGRRSTVTVVASFRPVSGIWSCGARCSAKSVQVCSLSDRACVVFDDRIAYGEDRFIATGTVDGRVYVVVFTMRGEVMRVISMRAA
jgi:Ribonuclease toxin, BrnT, of type II toxin-antitoxin system